MDPSNKLKALKAQAAQGYSFKDYLSGVAQVHKDIATKAEGAQRIEPAMRAAQKGMKSGEVVDQYNAAGVFGKTTKGEPIVARIRATTPGG